MKVVSGAGISLSKAYSRLSDAMQKMVSQGTSLGSRVKQATQPHFLKIATIAGSLGILGSLYYFLTRSFTQVIIPQEGPTDWSQCGLVPATPDFLTTECLAEQQCLNHQEPTDWSQCALSAIRDFFTTHCPSEPRNCTEPTTPFNPPLLPAPELRLQPQCLATKAPVAPLYPIVPEVSMPAPPAPSLPAPPAPCSEECNEAVAKASKKIDLLMQAMLDGAETPPSLEELDEMLLATTSPQPVSYTARVVGGSIVLLAALALKFFRDSDRAFAIAQTPDAHLDRPWGWAIF